MLTLKYDILELKKKQRDTPGISKSHQENIRDAFGPVQTLHLKGKATVVPKQKTQEELMIDLLKIIK